MLLVIQQKSIRLSLVDDMEGQNEGAETTTRPNKKPRAQWDNRIQFSSYPDRILLWAWVTYGGFLTM